MQISVLKILFIFIYLQYVSHNMVKLCFSFKMKNKCNLFVTVKKLLIILI